MSLALFRWKERERAHQLGEGVGTGADLLQLQLSRGRVNIGDGHVAVVLAALAGSGFTLIAAVGSLRLLGLSSLLARIPVVSETLTSILGPLLGREILGGVARLLSRVCVHGSKALLQKKPW